jgi:hypothetical protein
MTARPVAGWAGQPPSNTTAQKPNLWGPAKEVFRQGTVGGALSSAFTNPQKPSPALSVGATGYQAMQGLAKKMMPDGSHIQNVQQPNIRTFLPPLPAR